MDAASKTPMTLGEKPRAPSGQPWKAVGWLVVALLALLLTVPVLLAISIGLPVLQRLGPAAAEFGILTVDYQPGAPRVEILEIKVFDGEFTGGPARSPRKGEGPFAKQLPFSMHLPEGLYTVQVRCKGLAIQELMISQRVFITRQKENRVEVVVPAAEPPIKSNWPPVKLLPGREDSNDH